MGAIICLDERTKEEKEEAPLVNEADAYIFVRE